jgi:hypothetical protein
MSDKQTIAIVTACMRRNGTATFALNEVTVTEEEAQNGIHYSLAEAQLLEAGYEEPFVHFEARESPPFLHAAVRDYIASAHTTTSPEEPACNASSN